MKLEKLRSDDLGIVTAWLPKLGSDASSMVPLTFHEHATKAFYLTLQAVEQLERSQGVLSHGTASVTAAGMWFITAESFVNSMLRIACRATNDDFATYRGRSIHVRLTQLLLALKLDRTPLNDSGVLQRLEEFKTFRNELFHDRTWTRPLVFHKTSFSPVPHLANQVDAMQASVLVVELCHALRRAFCGADFMPEIVVSDDTIRGFLKMDFLYETLLQPFFSAALAKHSLSTDLVLTVNRCDLGTSGLSGIGDVRTLVKAAQEPQYRHLPNPAKTSYGASLLKQAIASIPPTDLTKFRVPKYEDTE